MRLTVFLPGGHLFFIPAGMCCLIFCSSSLGQTAGEIQPSKRSASNAAWVVGKFRESEFPAECVVAQWGNHLIQAGDVDFHLDRTLRMDSLAGETLQRARAETLQFLIDRRLVIDHLVQEKAWPGLSKIATAEEAQMAELELLGIPLEQFLKDQKISHTFWRTEIAWGIGWPEYINRTWSDERLRDYFAEHKRNFDGTRIKVGQILLEVKGSEDRERALKLASEIQSEIESGGRTFEDAVREYSIAPSKELAGELGWIERYQPMPEDFSRRVFQLQPGELAEPFASEFGVHLVKCLELETGKRMLGDVRREVLQAATKEEFARLRTVLPALEGITFHPEFPHWDFTKR